MTKVMGCNPGECGIGLLAAFDGFREPSVVVVRVSSHLAGVGVWPHQDVGQGEGHLVEDSLGNGNCSHVVGLRCPDDVLSANKCCGLLDRHALSGPVNVPSVERDCFAPSEPRSGEEEYEWAVLA